MYAIRSYYAIIFNTAILLPKTTRDTIGVQAMTLKANSTVEKAFLLNNEISEDS